MYVVVFKNRVITGPMTWNRAIFQGSLAKEGVMTQLPRVAPEQLPFVVSDDAVIMGVEEIRPMFNPALEYLYGPIWNILPDRAQATYLVYDSPISSGQGNLKALAAQERYRREVTGCTCVVQGVTVSLDTSREGRNIFVQKLSLMGETDHVNWKFPECWLNLTKSDLALIVATGVTHIQSAFDWEKLMSDQIDAAETKADLEVIQNQIMPVTIDPQDN